MGVSEGCVRNVMAYRQDTKQGPSILVNATQSKTEEIMDRQIAPLFQNTPRLAPNVLKASGNTVKLTKSVVDLGWPNSPITLADRSIRDGYGDETNKWPRFAKQEGSPADLIRVRFDTYYDQSLLVLLSSPTHSGDTISVEHTNAPGKIHGEVPCPACGKYQVYDFWNGVKWDKDETLTDNKQKSAAILDNGLAYYQCKHCEAKWPDSIKNEVALKMVYVFDGDTVTEEDIQNEHKELEKRLGRKVERVYNRIIFKGRKPSVIGVQLSGLFSPWRSYSRFLAEMYRSIGDPGKMQNFRNSWIGEDYEYKTDAIEPDDLERKVKSGGNRLKVPEWANCLIATADTQQTHFYYTVRAWGDNFRSQLIDHGMVDTFKALRDRTLDREFVVDKDGWGTCVPVKLFIDAGGGEIKGQNTTRTWQVYQFALSDPARIMPVRGHGGAYQMEGSLQKKTIDYTPPGQDEWNKEKVMVEYLRIDTGVYKDLLSSRIKTKEDDPDYWGLHNEKDGDYLAQITSEHKVLEGQGKSQHFSWKTKTAGAANHFFDCEVYQNAAAVFLRVDSLPSVASIMKASEDIESFNPSPQQQETRRW